MRNDLKKKTFENMFFQRYHCNFNYIFIKKVALARRQRRKRSFLQVKLPAAHLFTTIGEASHCPFNCRTSTREAVNTNFYSLWFDLPEN